MQKASHPAFCIKQISTLIELHLSQKDFERETGFPSIRFFKAHSGQASHPAFCIKQISTLIELHLSQKDFERETGFEPATFSLEG